VAHDVCETDEQPVRLANDGCETNGQPGRLAQEVYESNQHPGGLVHDVYETNGRPVCLAQDVCETNEQPGRLAQAVYAANGRSVRRAQDVYVANELPARLAHDVYETNRQLGCLARDVCETNGQLRRLAEATSANSESSLPFREGLSRLEDVRPELGAVRPRLLRVLSERRENVSLFGAAVSALPEDGGLLRGVLPEGGAERRLRSRVRSRGGGWVRERREGLARRLGAHLEHGRYPEGVGAIRRQGAERVGSARRGEREKSRDRREKSKYVWRPVWGRSSAGRAHAWHA
jgi:hypothetical protein